MKTNDLLNEFIELANGHVVFLLKRLPYMTQSEFMGNLAYLRRIDAEDERNGQPAIIKG